MPPLLSNELVATANTISAMAAQGPRATLPQTAFTFPGFIATSNYIVTRGLLLADRGTRVPAICPRLLRISARPADKQDRESLATTTLFVHIISQVSHGLWGSADLNADHDHFLRRAILTRKVGQTDLVLVCNQSLSVGPCARDYKSLCAALQRLRFVHPCNIQTHRWQRAFWPAYMNSSASWGENTEQASQKFPIVPRQKSKQEPTSWSHLSPRVDCHTRPFAVSWQ